eukprot:gene9341-7934_t
MGKGKAAELRKLRAISAARVKAVNKRWGKGGGTLKKSTRGWCAKDRHAKSCVMSQEAYKKWVAEGRKESALKAKKFERSPNVFWCSCHPGGTTLQAWRQRKAMLHRYGPRAAPCAQCGQEVGEAKDAMRTPE